VDGGVGMTNESGRDKDGGTRRGFNMRLKWDFNPVVEFPPLKVTTRM